MDIHTLTERAMTIRGRFAEFEQAKAQREWTKEAVMQGFVIDVGDLMKLAMAKSGIRHADGVDAKLEHELADWLWSVLVLARMHGIDLEKAFTKSMDELEVSIAANQAAARADRVTQSVTCWSGCPAILAGM